ncbi:MAG: ATP-binding protein [Thermoanaerobaculia bacterium]
MRGNGCSRSKSKFSSRQTAPAGGTLAFECAREGTEVVFRIRDSGVGISPELLPRIFDVFVQGAGAGSEFTVRIPVLSEPDEDRAPHRSSMRTS